MTPRSRSLAAGRSARWRALLACGALAVAVSAGGSAHGQEGGDLTGIIPYPVRTTTLDNGLKVIVMRMPSDGLVAFWSIVRTGSRDEYEPGRSGFAHFFEHMMFRGTEKHPADVYQRILTEFGADANAYTTDDHTAYHISMTAADLERVIELEADRFQNLFYAEADFQTEAGAVYGEYRKSRTDPEFALYEELMAKAFEKHTYGHTTLGYERDIAAMPTMYDYSRTFFARYYRPENTVLFFAGDVDAQRIFPIVERNYGAWQHGYVTPSIPVEPEQTAERRVAVAYEGETLPWITVAYKVPAFDPSDRTRVAADLLAELAFGETSEAYRQLVLDEQVVEFLDAGADGSRDPGLLDITTRVKDPAKVDYVLAALDATAAEYRDSPPAPERLAALQRRLKYAFLMGLQTPDSVAGRLAEFIALSGDLDGVRALYESYAAITPADVQAAARSYFQPTRRTVGVLRARE
jgi:zinc protease